MSLPARVVAIGASAGGVEALRTLAAGLPADLAAAVLIVLHIPSYAKSQLPAILSRAGPLPAKQAEDGETIEAGRIYVAPPDRHLLVRAGRIHLSSGPRENHSRPAIDPMFRSIAREYGSRAIGVVLSGALYDGSAGLLAIKARGGIAIVQDPNEAIADSMPRSALRLVDVDEIAPAGEIGRLLGRLVEAPATGEDDDMNQPPEPIEEVIREVIGAQAEDERADEVTIYTCPECGGVMFQQGEGAALSFWCHVGHAYAPELLLGQKADEIEAALWACMRMLTEKATLTRQLATRSRAESSVHASRAEEQAELAERQAELIKELLLSMPSAADLVESVNGLSAA